MSNWKCRKCGSVKKFTYGDICKLCYNQQYRIDNKSEINRQKIEYYKENKKERIDYAKSYSKKYIKTYNGKLNSLLKRTRRRAKLSGVISGFTKEEWLEIRDKSPMCSMCGRFVECDNLTIDHIISLSDGGENSKENVQALCRRCNPSKEQYNRKQRKR